MSRNELELFVAQVEDPGNRYSLIEALRTLSDNDSDFNGENGLEYMRSEVWEANGYSNFDEFANTSKDAARKKLPEPELRYESNQDYYLAKADEADDVSDKDVVNRFISEWMDHDSYYDAYKVHCFTDSNDNVTAIAVAV